MAVQSRLDIDITPFFLSGSRIYKDDEVIVQDAGRIDPLLKNTVMAQVASNKKWTPLVSVSETTGASIAKGIYVGDDIPAATIAAGDVTSIPIVIGGDMVTFDKEKLVFDGDTLSLDDEIGIGTVSAHRVEDDLNRIGLFAEETVNISGYENPAV